MLRWIITCFIGMSFIPTLHAQESSIEEFTAQLKDITPDSSLKIIALEIAQIDSADLGSMYHVGLLELKLKAAEKTNNRILKSSTYKELLDYPQKNTDKRYFQYYNEAAELAQDLGQSNAALQYYFDAAHLADSLHNDTLSAAYYKSIGTHYKRIDNPDLSLRYLNQALTIYQQLNDSAHISSTNMNIGNAYKAFGSVADQKFYLDTAMIYYKKSLKMAQTIHNERIIAGNYNNIGNVLRKQKKYEESLTYFFNALEINKKSQNRIWESYNYNNIAVTYQELGKYDTALRYLKKSLALKKELDDNWGIVATYLNLAQTSAKLGNYKNAYTYFEAYDEANKKAGAQKSIELAEQLEAEFQNKKKEAEIAALKAQQSLQEMIISNQQKDLAFQAALRNKEKNLIYALGTILIFLIITVIVFWRNMRQRKRYTQTLKQKNLEIAEVSQRIEKAHQKLAYKNQEITDSINYAKRIQAAILPSEKILKSHLKEAFVLYLPKDIVAGDFYWTGKVGDTILFAVADCTGHGVPGAMVSVICHNALETATQNLKLTDPGKILDETNAIVLQQFTKSEQTVKDGMDIALCAFNAKKRTLKFAGAHSPLWLIRNNKAIRHLGTKQPVGHHTAHVKFESKEIETQKGDFIYLASDGYPDQFGGIKGKKFLNKRFREMLIDLTQHPIHEQQKKAHDLFLQWKGRHEQIDDVCLMGIKIEH